LFDKCQVRDKVKTFVKRSQKEFGLPIKKMRSDNRTEFKNTQVEEFLDEEGIKHEFSTSYTPQQNGIVERKNRTLIDMARTMLDEYKTSNLFWCEAVNTACHTVNRLYLDKKLKKTSYELLTGNKPKVSYFIVFGVSVSYLTRDPKPLSLHLKLMRVFFLVMGQMSMPIVFLTKPPVELKWW
jgi:transposase InsO family protein